MKAVVGQAALISVTAFVGCAARVSPRQEPSTETRSASPLYTSTRGDAASQVAITVVGERPGPPPLVRLLVDITLSNPSGTMEWMLVPTAVARHGGRHGVDKLEQLSVGAISVGRFLGSGGLYAIALEPGARLTIKNLEIGWWQEPDAGAPSPLEIRIAKDVSLAGTSIATWFHQGVAARGTQEIDANNAIHTASRRAPGDVEVEVVLVAGRSVSIPVAR